MKTLFAVLFLIEASFALHAKSRIPVSEYIRDRCDVVVYGAVDFSQTNTITISNTGTGSTNKLHLISIRPYRFLPKLSPKYFWSQSYSIYVTESYYQTLKKNEKEYSEDPRFWGIRQTFLFGNLGSEIPIEGDTEFEKLESQLKTDFHDASRIRPLDLTPVKDKLTLTFDEAGTITLRNHSKYSIWLHSVSGDYLSSKKDELTYSITGSRDNSWINFGYGLSGPSGELYEKFNFARELKSGASVSFQRNLPKEDVYEAFRAEMFVYPDSSLKNELHIHSNSIKRQ